MRTALVLVALTLPVVVPAAPRLAPEVYFETADAKAYPVLIGPQEIGKIQMEVTFTVRGKKGATYTVELYVEVENTGEKAELLRSTTVKLGDPKEGATGLAEGGFKLRNHFPGHPNAELPDLPHLHGYRNWAYQLVLKDGKHIVATTSFAFVPFTRKYVSVPK